MKWKFSKFDSREYDENNLVPQCDRFWHFVAMGLTKGLSWT